MQFKEKIICSNYKKIRFRSSPIPDNEVVNREGVFSAISISLDVKSTSVPTAKELATSRIPSSPVRLMKAFSILKELPFWNIVCEDIHQLSSGLV